MKVTVVTVTYGERYIYLKQVIESSFIQGVDEIIVVSNGSIETEHEIKKLQKSKTNLKLIEINHNSGSANGFHEGIKYGYDNGAEHIWLLDDDNVPNKNALKALKDEWFNLEKKMSSNSFALLSYRDDRKLYSDAINLGDSKLMLGKNNSFLGFDIFDKVKKVFSKKNLIKSNQKDKGIVEVAPYGGLFFHKSLIPVIGFPDKSYFLYGDDFDYTYRITKNNGKIILIKKSKITDLEKSFHLIKTRKIFETRYFKTDSKDKIYYSVRNGVVFEQNFVTNKFHYLLNLIIYLNLVLLISLFYPKQLWKFKYIMKGVYSAAIKINS